MTTVATCAIDKTPSHRAATDSYEYDAFGNQITHTGTTANNYLYRGEQYDSDLGLYYLRARYYNPISGRFMSRDPNDPQLVSASGTPTDPKMLHKYLYAGGDPVDAADPSGRGVLDYVAIGVSAAVVVAAARSFGYCMVKQLALEGQAMNGAPPSGDIGRGVLGCIEGLLTEMIRGL